ncbi:Organic solvent tolerance protein OstA [Ignavibacterium album JCM 16511]|uniref:Organic solvent tolerance protein OstA n=1 Tax=Ignavibacterium album (strain DSM 19864 / JCM 16511 / NBRC 101810 / Mat9-16) TaxID=945713 RepID=I0AIF8_IGNAJ|nr:putative LPS assembly protein LptD [Ignavibacterium album]AFH48765.1 Organic solvent tolerance protein OstA [Ignavibacterium album JCM 16511]
MKQKLILILSLIFIHISIAQINDSILAPQNFNSLPDTSLNTKPKKYDVDTTVFAEAKDSIFFKIKEKKMLIYGNGNLKYKQTEIKSGRIEIDFEKSIIDAYGIKDDSLNKYIETPVLAEAGETYKGNRMKYNFKTQQGVISFAQTEQEGSKYTGQKIKKVDKDVYFISDGVYTTCEDSIPHYYFYSPKMKVIHKEQIVAEWIFLYFGGVPFPIPLPFAVFPIESGRRSGIIAPVFGDDGTYGTYFSRFGYFWAISDYMDLNMTGDYYTRGSYRINSLFRYAKRYEFNGSLDGSFGNFVIGEKDDPDRSESKDWRLRWNHNQTITPTMRFDARLEFLSNNQITRNISDINDLLRNEAVSNATLFKTWDESRNSISINYNRRQVFQTNEVFEILPSITFTMSQKYPFRSGSASTKNILETFGYSYSGNFENRRDRKDRDLKIRGGINHQLTASLSPKIGYFSISPSFNYQERWYNKRIQRYSIPNFEGKDSIITNDVKEINFVRTFSLGVSASTKFYGIFNPEMLGVKSIRHTVIPSISYSFTPDFSTDGWGYYDYYTNQAGQRIKYNKFENEIFGGASNRESQAINFSLSNIFEMKTQNDPTDTTSKENKIQLLNLGANIGYDFTADSLKFSDLRLNYRTQIGTFFSFNGASSFSLYDYEGKIPRVNRFLYDAGKGLLRLTSFNFSVSLTLSGEKLKSAQTRQTSRPMQESGFAQDNRNIYQGLYYMNDPDFTIPWDISLNYYFNESRPTPNNISKSSSISGSMNFNLTPAWKFSVTGSYDLNRKEFAAPVIRISRDLDCWIMNFTWNPVGTFRGYMFELRVKAPQLQDLKITKRDQFFEGR